MKCKKAEKLALLVFYSEASPLEQRRLDYHVRNCPDCAAKVHDLRGDLTKLRENISEIPEFSWEKSWEKMDAIIKREKLKHSMKPGFLLARPLHAAVVIGIFCLGILAGKIVFDRIPVQMSGEGALFTNISSILEDHLGTVRISLLEFLNFTDVKGEHDLWLFEKEHMQELLFQNRLLISYLKDSDSPTLIKLLEDLDLVLKEVANLSPDKPEYLSFIRSLLRDSDIIFRVNHFRWDEKEILL